MKRIRQSRLQLLTITALTQFTLTTGLVSAQQPEVLRPIKFRLDGDVMKTGDAPLEASQGVKAPVLAVANTFSCVPQAWNLQDLIVSDGSDVAIDANVAVVAARSFGAELAYIYRFNGAFWELEATLDSPITHTRINSGNMSVAIDGNVIAISQPGTDFSGSDEFNTANLGVVHVFRHDETSRTWQLDASLTLPSPPDFANFGFDVAISGDTLLIGTPGIERAIVYQRTKAGWIEQQQLVASDGIAGDAFGTSVAISGDKAIVSAPLQVHADQADGSAYLFQFDGTRWNEQAKLTHPPLLDFTQLSRYAASVAMDGITVVVGSPNYQNGSFRSRSFVYRFDGTSWNLIAALAPDTDDPDSTVGTSLDIEGNVIVSTDNFDDDDDTKAIYVFQEVDGQWLKQVKLIAPLLDGFKSNENSVAISQGHILAPLKRKHLAHYSIDPPPDCNGNGIPDACDIIDNPGLDCNLNYVIDACDIANGFSTDCDGNQVPDECEPDCDLNGVPDSCDIFGGFATDTNANGVPDACECPVQRKILPAFPKTWSRFGAHTRIDGNLAIIGAWSDDNEAGVATGAAYIYRRQGLDWTYSAKLLAPDGEELDGFGNYIDISGHVAVIGVPHRGFYPGNGDEAVYVYRYHPATDQWIEEAILRAADLSVTAGRSFGQGVDVEGDVLAVHTSISEGDISYTAAIIFRYDASTKSWVEEDHLPTSDIDTNSVGSWSPSNWIKLRGDRLIVGAANAFSGDNGYIPGTVFIYRYIGGAWELEQRLFSESGNPRDFFGFDVDLDGERAIVGAAWDDQGRIERGAAYIYHFDGVNWNLEQKIIPPLEHNTKFFGVGVTVRGTTATIVGSRIFPPSLGNRSVLFIYEYVQPLNRWVLNKSIQAFDGAGHHFGYPLTTDGDSIIFSSPGDSEAGPFTGAAYVVTGIFGPDCNANSKPDACDIEFGGLPDVNNDGVPDECFAPSDYNYDGRVNVSDLLTLLSAWGNCPVSSICPADTNGDGKVNVTELLMMLAAWG